MFKTIIWASDGSDHANRALELARGLADESSARLLVVHVKEITVGRGGGYPVLVDEEEIERQIQAQAKDMKDAGIDATYQEKGTSAGGAAHAIADAATELGADLIVVGTRGQGPVLAVPPA
jgi:nucleotide-binding universal stress UspA family protein